MASHEAKRVEIVFFDGGGGHRSAAVALEESIRIEGRDWDVRLVNLRDVIGRLDPVKYVLGVRLEDFYNRMLKEGWTFGSSQLLGVYHAGVRVSHSSQVALLRQHWKSSLPDLVVSVIPHFNRAILQGLHEAAPGVPFVTVMTDIADCPPHFWIEREQPHLVCGSDRAYCQALGIGLPEERVWKTSGMILHPRFYGPLELDVCAERMRVGLAPELATGLILFGGEGSRVMVEIAERLSATQLPVQLILMCGRNAELAAKLRAMRLRLRVLVVEFTPAVPYYMRLADFFVGKPGPGSLSEAVAMGLPVITERNAWTMPQERYNTDWVRDQGLGLVLGSFSRIAPAVTELLRPEVYSACRTNVAAINNRAVFEVPAILEQILANARQSRARAAS